MPFAGSILTRQGDGAPILGLIVKTSPAARVLELARTEHEGVGVGGDCRAGRKDDQRDDHSHRGQ